MYTKKSSIILKITASIMVLFTLSIIITSKFNIQENLQKYTVEENKIACTKQETLLDETLKDKKNNMNNENAEKEVVSRDTSSRTVVQETKLNQSESTTKTENQLGYNNKQQNQANTESQEAKQNQVNNENEVAKQTQTNKRNEETNKNQTTNKNEETQNSKTNNNTIVEKQYKGFETVGKIEIQKTGLNLPILSQVTVQGMEVAPCLLYSKGEINQSGNTVIVGHNYNNIFSKNKNLEKGDKISITTLDGQKVTYTIYSKFRTTPDEVDYLARKIGDKPEITLSTCTESDKYRLVILAVAD